MKKFFCALLLMTAVVGCGKVVAQFNNNYWVFGDSAYIDWSNTAAPAVGNGPYYYRNGSSSIGNQNGLVMSAGLINNSAPLDCFIWNKYGKRIGDSIRIKGGLWYHASLFVPDPGNDSNIYLLTAGVTSVESYGLYYSKVNYKANNDSGLVIQKNIVLNTFPAFDALMAVKHGNGRDWWLITQQWVAPNAQTPNNEFWIYLISP
ncbi:MAG: hypothetical protein IPM91_15560 [Bacteroidetes bacterium]|nr:hypothetical protein [Bacteroidota bacterium]